MAQLVVKSLAELDPAVVQRELDLITQMVQEKHPSFDLRRGVIHDVVLLLHAALAAVHRENIDRLRRSQSLVEALADPRLADPEIVDRIASNFLLQRRKGSRARGNITIVLDRAASITVTSGTSFEAHGKRFVTETSYSSRLSEATLSSPNDRVLRALSDGNYAFNIPVVAEEEGSASQVRKDTAFVPTVSIPYFVTAYAAEDFVRGVDAETNESLLQRILRGAAAKATSGRLHMSAALREEEPLTDIVADEIIGFGDPEMYRDRHGLLPISTGNCADWYVRTAELPVRTSLSKTAVFLGRDAESGEGIWQFSVGREDLPGFYDVVLVRPEGATATSGSCRIVEDVRGYDVSDLGDDSLLPDIRRPEEAAFSRFQTAVLRILDPVTPTLDLVPLESTQRYEVVLRGMPHLAVAQRFAASRATRHYGGDILVRAPLPCFLRVSFAIYLPAGCTVDLPAITTDLCTAVNRAGMPGRLSASQLAGIVQKRLPAGAFTGAFDLFGKILLPDTTVRYIRSQDLLEAPTAYNLGLSARTLAFILEPESVAISMIPA